MLLLCGVLRIARDAWDFLFFFLESKLNIFITFFYYKPLIFFFFFHLPAAFGGIHRDAAHRRKLNSDFSSLYGSCGYEIDVDSQNC